MSVRDNIKTAKDLQDTYKIILKILEQQKILEHKKGIQRDTSTRIECIKQVIKDLGLIIK